MTASEQKALQRFVHHMNNSLNAISMQTELALLHTESENIAEIAMALKTIQTECRRASAKSQKAYEELTES
ncbi:MAG: hypothetical protein P8X98_06595 [Woeseiaceae bacterium]